MVGETKILERQVTDWKILPPTTELERWQVTLNWYAWEGDKVIVNVKVTNIMQKKATTPLPTAFDSDGNQGDILPEPKDWYSVSEIWPGKYFAGNVAFQFGPLSKGVKLYVHFFMETEQRVEFSLGR